MRVFVTGATGFIGSAIVKELISAGHRVTGLVRSDDKAAALEAIGAEVELGSLEDYDRLREAAASSDAVIHTAFNHDFSKFVENCENDRRVIETLSAAIAGAGRPLIVTSGVAVGGAQPGTPLTEEDRPPMSSISPRAASEEAAYDAVARGVNVSVVRLPQVHDTVRHGLVTYAIATAREKGVAAYVGDGTQRWPAAHVTDVARLYRLALEQCKSGAVWHAVAEEGLRLREIAEAIGRRFELPVYSVGPEEAEAHFGWLAAFASLDAPAISQRTQRELGWHPAGPGLIADIEASR